MFEILGHLPYHMFLRNDEKNFSVFGLKKKKKQQKKPPYLELCGMPNKELFEPAHLSDHTIWSVPCENMSLGTCRQ